ncbi:AAA domain protein [Leptospira kirschneri str. 200801774]|uniref:ATP-binding protein n=1 Tax=Leptospira kirschneri TaxID=29507 RepID=UPI0002BD71CB|nr:ATP-binding protein [Leptospira kirschneri]EMO80192.1 AAA domain protein [Leptospira kirschneri str. 200801774]
MKFLWTDQLKRALRRIDKTINNNGWLLITGEVGTGKTTLRRYLSSDYAEEKNYLVLNVTSWRNQGRSRAPALMTRMIRSLSPDSPVPSDVELREERLRTLLLRLSQKQKKEERKKKDSGDAKRVPTRVVLVIDSAQDISDSTFRELKKLREIHSDPLFTVLMFGNESATMDNVLSGREVGYRCGYMELELLTKDEVLDFATDRFDVSFEPGKSGDVAKRLFCETVHPSPLGIEYFKSCLDELSGFDGVATRDLIKRAALVDLGFRVDKSKILISDITQEAKLIGVRLTTDDVTKAITGKSKAPEEKLALIQNLTEKVIRKKSSM